MLHFKIISIVGIISKQRCKMSRNDYDDMGQSFSSSRRRGDKKTYIISFMGVLIILIAIMVAMIFKPSDNQEVISSDANSPELNLEIPEVKEVSVERSNIMFDERKEMASISNSTESVISDDFILPSSGMVSSLFFNEYEGRVLDGVTFSSEAGSAVYSVSDGIVSDAGLDNEYGRYVVIDHRNGIRSGYYCLETVSVKIGEKVNRGDIIGSIGSSDHNFSTPTLFFRLEKEGKMVDPMQYF